VQDRERIDTDERLESFLADRSVYEVIRVRAVQHDKLFVVFGAGFHHVMHRADIGIETGTYILYIENNHVEVAQLLGGRFLVFPINRDDGDACFQVSAVFYLLSGITGSPESMFRSEHLLNVYAFRY